MDADVRARLETFGLMFLVAQQLARRADAELAEYGLTTSQWLLLAVLARRFPGESPRLGEAAAVYGTSRQNTKQVARQLEARGYLELRPDPEDARAVRLHLTRKIALFDRPRAAAEHLRFIEKLFSPLAAGEVAELEALLRRWLAGLEARPGQRGR